MYLYMYMHKCVYTDLPVSMCCIYIHIYTHTHTCTHHTHTHTCTQMYLRAVGHYQQIMLLIHPTTVHGRVDVVCVLLYLHCAICIA